MNVVLVYVAVAGFVTPLMPIVVAVLAGNEQDPAPALSESVTVMVGPAVVAPAAEQFVKPAPSVIVGVPVTANEELKTAVIVDPPTRAPFALDVNPAVHDVGAAAACVVPLNETDDGLAAARMVAEATAAVSLLVLMLIDAEPVVVVFVIPRIWNDAPWLFGTEHVCPATFPSRTVTVVPTVLAEAVHVAANVALAIVGVAGIVPPVQVGNATVIELPDARAPELLGVKPIVQFAFAPAAGELGAAVWPLIDGSMTYGSGRCASSSRSSSRQPSAAFRRDQ